MMMGKKVVLGLIFSIVLVSCKEAVTAKKELEENPSIQSDSRPVISSITSLPRSVGQEFSIRVTGANLGGDSWKAQLKNNGLTVNLETKNLTSSFAELVVPKAINLAEGIFSLVISNAHGQDSGQVVTLKGDKGDKGDQGITGPQGPAGPQGPTGLQGPVGLKGDTGLIDPSAVENYSIPRTKIHERTINSLQINPAAWLRKNGTIDSSNSEPSFSDDYQLFPEGVYSSLLFEMPDQFKNKVDKCGILPIPLSQESKFVELKDCQSKELKICFNKSSAGQSNDLGGVRVRVSYYNTASGGSITPTNLTADGVSRFCVNAVIPSSNLRVNYFKIERLGGDSLDAYSGSVKLNVMFVSQEPVED